MINDLFRFLATDKLIPVKTNENGGLSGTKRKKKDDKEYNSKGDDDAEKSEQLYAIKVIKKESDSRWLFLNYYFIR